MSVMYVGRLFMRKIKDDEFVLDKERQKKQLNEAAVEYVASLLSDTNVYVTLTYEHIKLNNASTSKSLPHLMHKSYKHIKLTRASISKSLSHFIHNMNRKLFGNNYRRNNKSIAAVPFIETISKLGRKIDPHVHMSIKVPKEYIDAPFKLKWLIRSCHEKTKYANHQTNVQIQNNNYIQLAKYNLKDSFEAVDINNLVMTDSDNRVLQRQFLH